MIASWVERARASRRDDGAAAVEFALVLPLLMMLVFGIISFGILFAQQLSLGNGARQGARLGVVADRTCADIVNEARDGAQTLGMDASDIRVVVELGPDEDSLTSICDVAPGDLGNTTVPCATSDSGDKLFVYAVYASSVSVPLVPLKKTMILESVGVFRCEFTHNT